VTARIQTLEVSFWSDGSLVQGLLSRPAAKGVYPAVVWSHGYGAYASAIGAAVVGEYLPAEGIALLRLDHRGCGRSASSAAGPCVQGHESVQDLISAVSYLATRQDVDGERVVLMGESHGGSAAVAAGALDQRVIGVLASDAFSDGRSWLRELWRNAGREEQCDELVRRGQRTEAALASGQAPEVVPVEEVIPYAPEDLALFRSLCELHPLWSRRASLATVQALEQLQPASLGHHLRDRPVRLLHGEDDGTVPVAHLHRLGAAVGTDDYHIVLGAGHGVTSACPEAVLPLMLEWLDKVLNTKGR
jgi:uncharacterized protein